MRKLTACTRSKEDRWFQAREVANLVRKKNHIGEKRYLPVLDLVSFTLYIVRKITIGKKRRLPVANSTQHIRLLVLSASETLLIVHPFIDWQGCGLSLMAGVSPEWNSNYGLSMIDGFRETSHSSMGHKYLKSILIRAT